MWCPSTLYPVLYLDQCSHRKRGAWRRLIAAACTSAHSARIAAAQAHTHTHTTHHTPHTTHHTCLTTRQSPGTHCTGHCLLGLIQSYCDSIHQNAWVAAWVQEFPEPTPPATRGFGAIHPPNPRVFGVSFSGRACWQTVLGGTEGGVHLPRRAARDGVHLVQLLRTEA